MHEPTGPPPVPSLSRLAWLLFMQPIKLHHMMRAWGMERDAALWQLWPRLRAKDPSVRLLVLRLALLLFVCSPALIFGLSGYLALRGLDIAWGGIAIGCIVGIAIGIVDIFSSNIVRGAAGGIVTSVAFCITTGYFFSSYEGFAEGTEEAIARALVFGIPEGAGFGLAFGIILGTLAGVIWGIAGGFVKGIADGLTEGIARSLTENVAVSVAVGIAILIGGGAAFGIAVGFGGGIAFGFPLGIAVGGTWMVASLRLPFLLWEIPCMICLATLAQLRIFRLRQLARWLPFHFHDLIYLPLLGLRSFLLVAGETDPELGQQLIAEAADSTGQKRPARQALLELEARSLERAARDGLYNETAEMNLPFLSDRDTLPAEDPVPALVRAATNLRALELSANQYHRRELLERAADIVKSAHLHITKLRRPEPRARRLRSTLRLWLDRIGEEQARLNREVAERPQVPAPFIAGSALGPAERQLFKGRRDLVRSIDHDLTGERRAPLLVLGQRRIGKSSLLNMLPLQLGTGTVVVSFNFQGLSGSALRDQPHRLIAASLAAAWPPAPPPPDSAAWSETLAWMHEVETTLAAAGQRLLLAFDEVERLEDGIRAGWGNTDFLDLVRAAGDTLRRIRFLLIIAYPLPRLGPHWVDRLINILPRQLGPLDEAAARELIREPIVGFPDIYPPDGVERILAETHHHPYLIQLVCDLLCRRLNERQRLRASPADLEAVLDQALVETPLFDELWRQRTDEERALLDELARGKVPGKGAGPLLRRLAREGYLTLKTGPPAIAVPMFHRWIAEYST